MTNVAYDSKPTKLSFIDLQNKNNSTIVNNKIHNIKAPYTSITIINDSSKLNDIINHF